jgi:hypothetical protein
MMVYHHNGQVKVQKRNWNLTLSVFWMMKIRPDERPHPMRMRSRRMALPTRQPDDQGT